MHNNYVELTYIHCLQELYNNYNLGTKEGVEKRERERERERESWGNGGALCKDHHHPTEFAIIG